LRTTQISNASRSRELPELGRPPKLPDFVVIGAMKSGTTSLHHYLSLHPDITMSTEKEPTFFTKEGRWADGVEWYGAQFEGVTKCMGEASPDYTKFPRHAGAPARMHSVLPDAKLIYIVRDPVERVISHYIDAFSFGRTHRSLDDVLDEDEGRHYIACSKYFLQLEQYLAFYAPERILIAQAEALASRRPETLTRIFEFLGADPTFTDEGFSRVLYQRAEHRRKTRVGYGALRFAKRVRQTALGRRLPAVLAQPIHAFNAVTATPVPQPELSTARRHELIAEFQPDVAQLRAFTGDELPGWCL
jgi:hypothetical protein